jgi:photosystem II stability/assembly factor-like uncharacterized protein
MLLQRSAAGETYAWDNVLLGGGGYVIGMEIHPDNPELIYARTDVGGCYRWDPAAGRMRQLMKWMPPEDENMWGIAGLALDPDDQNLVYIAAGKYPSSGRPADVFKSSDQGESWTSLAFDQAQFGSNNHPYRQSRPLMVNPHATAQLWCGTTGNGLHVYENGDWRKIGSVPDGESVRTVLFDPANPAYVYVAVYGAGVYRSIDGGESFDKAGSSQTAIVDMSLSRDGGTLYCVGDDGLQRLDNCRAADQWRDITPEHDEPYRTVAASPHENGVIMTFRAKYGNLKRFWVSLDHGDNWDMHDADLDNLDQRYPWHTTYMAGSCVASIVFAPDNPKKVYIADWYSMWSTEDWSEEPVQWSNAIDVGHEELCTAILTAAHPDNTYGAIIYSGGADVGGFASTALREPPPTRFRTSDALREVMGIDYSESNPDFMAVVGAEKWSGDIGAFGYSTDGGETIQLSDGYSESWDGGKVAISATDHENLVVATIAGGLRYSTDGGRSFDAANGPDLDIGGVFSYKHMLVSDRVNGDFYAYEDGVFYRSDDGGRNFSSVYSSLSSTDGIHQIAAAPGKAGLVYAAVGGLYKTADGGDSFEKIDFFDEARLTAVGAPRPGGDEPSVYVFGQGAGDDGLWFYRSDDGGESWVRINDEENRLGNRPGSMAACRRQYGRMFVGTHGSGVFYGEPAAPSDAAPARAQGRASERVRATVRGGVLSVSDAGAGGYAVLTPAGRLVVRAARGGESVRLPAGVYVVRVRRDNQLLRRRVLIP